MADELKNIVSFLTRKDLNFERGAQFGLRATLTGIDTSVVNITGFTREGMFKLRLTHSGDGTAESTNFSLPDIPTMVSMFCSADTMDRGEMWAELWLTVNGERVFRFGSGYMSAQTAISWPSQINETEMPGRGFMTNVTGVNQAANVECTDDVPGNEMWILKGYKVVLVTDANVANRRVHLNMPFGGNSPAITAYSTIDQTAGTTITYIFAPFGSVPLASSNNTILIPIPPDIVMKEADTISTTTVNRQVGDNFGAPKIYVEKFMVS